MTTVNFGSGGRRTATPYRVFLRQRWSDAWTEYPYLECVECTWACAPTMPTATLQWDYGVIKRQGLPQGLHYDPLTVERWFVKILFQMEPYSDSDSAEDIQAATQCWIGIIGDVDDANAGLVRSGGLQYARGRQTLSCYGME
jgi:hypothetical protein